MIPVKKEYVVTANNKKAVLIDIDTFRAMEEIIENYGLGKFMKEIENESNLSPGNAQKYYAGLIKG